MIAWFIVCLTVIELILITYAQGRQLIASVSCAGLLEAPWLFLNGVLQSTLMVALVEFGYSSFLKLFPVAQRSSVVVIDCCLDPFSTPGLTGLGMRP